MAAHLAHVLWATGRLRRGRAARRARPVRRPRRHHDPDHGPPRAGLRRARPRRAGGRDRHGSRRPASWASGWASSSGSRRPCGASPRSRGCAETRPPPSSGAGGARRPRAAVADAAYLYPFLVTGTRALLERGDIAGAEAWVERVASRVAARGIPGTLPAIDHARGLVAHGPRAPPGGRGPRSRRPSRAGRRATGGGRARGRRSTSPRSTSRANRPDQASTLATEARDAAGRAAPCRSRSPRRRSWTVRAPGPAPTTRGHRSRRARPRSRRSWRAG